MVTTAMDTTTISHNSHKMISNQAMATMAIMATTDSMAIQAIGHKMTSNQLPHIITQITSIYLHSPIHLNHNDQTTNTSRHLKIKIKIVQMAMEMAISILKADIDTKR